MNHKFFRFIIIGIINTLFGAGVYSLLIYLGISYAWALLISTILGILFNFKTTGIYVFDNHDNRLIFRFFTIYSIIYVINVLIVKFLIRYTDINAYISGYIAIPIVAILSFILQKKFVFKGRNK